MVNMIKQRQDVNNNESRRNLLPKSNTYTDVKQHATTRNNGNTIHRSNMAANVTK